MHRVASQQENASKIIMKLHLTPIRMAIIPKQNNKHW